MNSDILLEVEDLRTKFTTHKGTVHAVNGVNFSLRTGETLAIVGESGCGKTAAMLSILRLLPPKTTTTRAKKIHFMGQDLLAITDKEIRKILGTKIGIVFQDPMSSLNPAMTIGRQITESLEVHLKLPFKKAQEKSIELLSLVGIPNPEKRINDYPHQFSGGMCQRVMIATALSCSPHLLIADEPTTALDVTIQAQILDLVTRLRNSQGMSIIWITHDLGVVAELANRVAVMYGGYIVENGEVEQIFSSPKHPYTMGLLESIPNINEKHYHKLLTIPGQPPNLIGKTTGCPFAERCKYVFDKCYSEIPPLVNIAGNRQLACWWDLDTNEERAEV